MLKVIVKDEGSFDKALKKIKRKVKETKLFKNVYDRREYKKPSVVKRDIMQKAKRKEKYINNNNI